MKGKCGGRERGVCVCVCDSVPLPRCQNSHARAGFDYAATAAMSMRLCQGGYAVVPSCASMCLRCRAEEPRSRSVHINIDKNKTTVDLFCDKYGYYFMVVYSSTGARLLQRRVYISMPSWANYMYCTQVCIFFYFFNHQEDFVASRVKACSEATLI